MRSLIPVSLRARSVLSFLCRMNEQEKEREGAETGAQRAEQRQRRKKG